MNSSDELERLRSAARVVNRLAWAVVVGIMICRVPIVYGYLSSHDIPKQTAWMLSLIVDGALAVAMVATPLLAQYGVKAGWVGLLRFVAGTATWALNTAGSWTKPDGPDLAGVVSRTWGPVLMFFAVEAAARSSGRSPTSSGSRKAPPEVRRNRSPGCAPQRKRRPGSCRKWRPLSGWNSGSVPGRKKRTGRKKQPGKRRNGRRKPAGKRTTLTGKGGWSSRRQRTGKTGSR